MHFLSLISLRLPQESHKYGQSSYPQKILLAIWILFQIQALLNSAS